MKNEKKIEVNRYLIQIYLDTKVSKTTKQKQSKNPVSSNFVLYMLNVLLSAL